jgi:hypothetical protein
MGLPSFLAAARMDDPERIAWLADELIDSHDNGGAVYLLQCGRASIVAGVLANQLQKLGRRSVSLVLRDRQMAQSDSTLSRIASAGAVWVFAEDLLEAFLVLFATQLAWTLRAKARAGFPVIGVGGGAVALGGLLMASRVCPSSTYDLVGGLGWASRVFVDSDTIGGVTNPNIPVETVRALPALLGVHLGVSGAARVRGGRVESVGTEPVVLLGGDGSGTLQTLWLDPGTTTAIAPPPFAPFERLLLTQQTLSALTGEQQARPPSMLPAAPPGFSQAPPPPEPASHEEDDETHAELGSGRYCPMCKQIHSLDARVELVA